MVDDGADPGRFTEEAGLRALAHPIRWALIEALGVEGTATAARCAELIGESHGSCSFHLRQLARFGVVEQAPTQSRRDRPWRLSTVHQSWPSGPSDDPARDRAAQNLTQVFVQRETDRLRRWVHDAPAAPADWRHASFESGALAWLTPDELRELSAAIGEVLQTHLDRIENPTRRPEGAKPVRLFAAGYPVFSLDPETDIVGPA